MSEVQTMSDLAGKINVEHRAVEDAATSAVEHAIRCGEYLIEAKAEAGHGNWLSWFEAQGFDFSIEMAKRYMRVARNRGELENRPRMTDLSLNGALRELAPEPEEDQADIEEADLVMEDEGDEIVPFERTTERSAEDREDTAAAREARAEP